MITLANTSKYFKGRHFDHKIILLSVPQHVTNKLNYRDLVKMMDKRGISLVHTTYLLQFQS